MMKWLNKTTKGFTLVELLIVIAIISILVTIVLIAINPKTVLQQTTDTKKRTELNQIKSALQLYFNDLNNYPTDINDLVPTYSRQLPSWWADDGDYGSDGASDYDAGVALDQPGVDDANSVTRCTSEPTNYASGDFMICPD